MKRKLLLSSTLALLALVYVGCSEEPEELKHYTTESSGPAPKLEGFDALVVNTPTEAIDFGTAEPFKIEWASDAQFSIYEVDGDWVANMKIENAAADIIVFKVVGTETRLNDDTNYVAVYPATKATAQGSYEEYLAALKQTTASQTQKGVDNFDHLNSSCAMQATFKGDDAITFEWASAFAKINFKRNNGETPESMRFEDGENSYKIFFEDFPEATTDEQLYSAYIAINTATTETRSQSFYATAGAGNPYYTIVKCSDNYSAGNVYTFSAFQLFKYTDIAVSLPSSDSAELSFAWAEGDKIALYNSSSKAWVADCIYNSESAKFDIEGDVIIDNQNSYVAAYPAISGAQTLDSYTATAQSNLAEQKQSGSASSDHLKGAGYMLSAPFKGLAAESGNVEAALEFQNSYLALSAKMAADKTPTSLSFADGGATYNIAIEGATAGETLTAYIAVMPTTADERAQQVTIVDSKEVATKYNATSTAEYALGALSAIDVDSEMSHIDIREIATADALMEYLANPTTDAMLTANIDLAGVEVTPSPYFTKTLDGNGKKISNLTITSETNEVALFKGLKAGAVIKNLTIENAKITGTSNVGVIVSKVLEGGIVENCAIVASEVSATNNIVGGVAGLCTKGTIVSCSVDATILSNATYAGGIVGKAISSTIAGCSFSGSAKGTNLVAGIAGENSAEGSIYGCSNSGTIIGVTKVGGIVGSYPSGGAITACYNRGKIGDADITTGSTAGIIGEAKATVNINGCYNLSEFGKEPNNGNIGQISGFIKAAGAVVTLTDCYYIKLGTGNSAFGTACADIAELNAKVEVMNATINATQFATYNFTAGGDSAADAPTLVVK